MAVFVADYHLKMTFVWFICVFLLLIFFIAFTFEETGFLLNGVHRNKNDKKEKCELGAFPSSGVSR